MYAPIITSFIMYIGPKLIKKPSHVAGILSLGMVPLALSFGFYLKCWLI